MDRASAGPLTALFFRLGFGAFGGLLLFELPGQLLTFFGAGFGAFLALLVEFLFGPEQLNISHLGGIALTWTLAGDPRVSAVTVAVAWCDDGEEAVDGLGRQHIGER